MNELKNRGLNDLLIAVFDGLKGFPEAISAVYPDCEIQTCNGGFREYRSALKRGLQSALVELDGCRAAVRPIRVRLRRMFAAEPKGGEAAESTTPVISACWLTMV